MTTRKNIIPFVVVATARTGSSFLVHLLNTSEDVFCHGELFMRKSDGKERFIDYCYRELGGKLGFKLLLNKFVAPKVGDLYGKKLLKAYLQKIYSGNKKMLDEAAIRLDISLDDKELTYIGFKLMVEHLRFYPYLIEELSKYKIKVINLIRENILAQAISTIQLHENKIAHTISGEVSPKVTIPLGLLEKHLTDIESIQKQQKQLFAGKEALTLNYEDIFNPNFPLNISLKEFLGCKSMTLNKVSLKKIGGKTLKEQVVNYDEVSSYLINNNYAKLIY